MSLNIVVLAKQVPDTRNVGKDAMKADGTINRAAMVRESLYRGGDDGVVLTDRPLGGADTLATSYSLAQAIKHLGKVDIIVGGRQAIDGDTAQVGPQIAEKLGLPQVTYAEELRVADGIATVKRRIERGFETVQCPLPLVVTVNGSADACRPRNAKLIQKYKYAVTPSEKAQLSEQRQALVDERPYLQIREWGVADIEADPEQIGLKGSPTKVKTVVNVVFQAKESKKIEAANEAELEGLVKELIADHIIG